MKVVINKCYGGFNLSRKALHRLREMGNQYALDETDIGEKWKNSDKTREPLFNSFLRYIPRNDPDLVKVVEELKEEANGPYANLVIIEIPDGIEWVIDKYDGMEHVEEEHRIWG